MKKNKLFRRSIAALLAAIVLAGTIPVSFLSAMAVEETVIEEDVSTEEETVLNDAEEGVVNTDSENEELLPVEDDGQEEISVSPVIQNETESDQDSFDESTDQSVLEIDEVEEDSDDSPLFESEELEENLDEEEIIEEPVGNEDTSTQTEAKGGSITDIDPLAESIADGDKVQLSATEDETYFYKVVPTDTFESYLRSYATQNASLHAYMYDADGNLIAESEEIDDQNFELYREIYNGEVYYFQVDLTVEDPELGPGTSKILFASSDNYSFSCEGIGDHERADLLNSEMTLSVSASSPTEIFYQWYAEDELIEGETSASYTFTVNKTCRYRCEVWDELNNSGECDYMVYADNQLSIWPEGGDSNNSEFDLHVEPGDQAQMKVVVSAMDTSQITYEWYLRHEWEGLSSTYVSYSLIEGETEDTLLLENPITGEKYRCLVRDQYGNSQEQHFRIYVDNELTVFLEEPDITSVDIDLVPGESVNLRVFATAKDDTQLRYEWHAGGELLEETQEGTYELEVPQCTEYRCIVSDQYGNSGTVSFFVNVDNELIIWPEGGESGISEFDFHVEPGDQARMKVNASANDPDDIKYQWFIYYETSDMWSTHVHTDLIEGATEDTFILETPKTGDTYICNVSDKYGSSQDLRFNVYVDNELTVYAEEPENTEAYINAAPRETVLLRTLATAKDDTELTYDWYQRGDLLEENQENTYELEVPQSTEYRCIVKDQYGNSSIVSFFVYVENNLTVYAGGTFETVDDIYVFPGDQAVLNVDVSAIDDSEMTYVWYRNEYCWNAYYDWYSTRVMDGENGPECIIEEFSDHDLCNEYTCEAIDRYGNSVSVTFKIHVVEETQYLAVRLLDTSENTISDGFTVTWYSADGTVLGMGEKIHNVEAQTQYECRVSLGEELSYQYVQPEPIFYTAGEDSETFDVLLTEIEPVAVMGTVSNKAGERIPGANVRLKQVYNGQYVKILDAETDDNGAFSFDAYKTKTTLIVSAEEYYDGYYSVPAVTEEAAVSIDAVLEEIPSNRITLKLYRQDAALEGEEAVTTELSNANGLRFSARNLTRMCDITEFKVQFPYIVLDEGAAEPGDLIRLTAEDDNAGMTADPIIVTLDESSCAEADWTFLQNGRIRIREITGNDENVVFVFDANGKCVQSSNITSSFKSDPLPDGNYSCVLMGKTDFLRNVDTLTRLAEFGLTEETDYIRLDVIINKGLITQINGVVVPLLNINNFVYTVADNTRLWANRMEAVTGQYVQMRLMYEIDEKYTTSDETMMIEIPEGMTFVERSLTLNGRACGCQVTDHDGVQTVTVPVNSRKSILRFYVLPTSSGNKNVFANLSFLEGSIERKQPVGSLSINVSADRIRVPEATSQKSVTVTGQTLADCEITVYDNYTAVGTTTSNKNGSWSLTFDLVNPRKYSNHEIYASVVSMEYGVDIETAVAELFYNCNYADLSKVTMINTAHPASNSTPIEYRTVFDFLHSTTTVPVYRYWPAYPTFTFVVEFTNDSADAISDVFVVTTNSAGDKTRIACNYDEEGGVWIGTHDYLNASDTPCKVGVRCNNDTDTIYDFTLDKEEIDNLEYNNTPNLDAFLEETTDVENIESTEGKISDDILIEGTKIGRYSLEILDYDSFDIDEWKNSHETESFKENGKTCYSSFEISGDSLTMYVVNMNKEFVVHACFESSLDLDSISKSALDTGEAKNTSASLKAALDEAYRLFLKMSGSDKAFEEFEEIGGYGRYLDQLDMLEKRFASIQDYCTCNEVVSTHNAGVENNAREAIQNFKYYFWTRTAFMLIFDIETHHSKTTDIFNLGPDVKDIVISLLKLKRSECEDIFENTLHGLIALEMSQKICDVCAQSEEPLCPCVSKDKDDEELPAIGEFDPSGYVFEAVPSNRVSGVKAEIYSYDYAIDEFGVQEDNKSEILWDAENYDQVNPQYTDVDGTFGWDVPEGQWLVKFTKEGYEDTDSRSDVAADEEGYLPVPPIQTEVNTAIVSMATPEVSGVEAYPEEIRIEFTQYMQIDSVSTSNVRVTSGGKAVSGTISPLNAEYNYEETEQFASYFAFVPDQELSGTVNVSVSGVINYCGKAMTGSYNSNHAVKIMPKKLEIIGSKKIQYHDSSELTVKVTPSEAGANRTITITSYSPSIISVEDQTVTTDQNGVAKIVLNGNLPGQGVLSVSLDGTKISEEIVATVSEDSTPISLEEGGYNIQLDKDAVQYSGKPITPAVTVDGLTEGTDFTVSYENNTNPGTATITVTGAGNYTGTITGTFLILPGKTSRGDLFNLASSVKVTWKEVPGAKYYKVYREGVTDPGESVDEPVFVTSRLYGYDSKPGLTNGNAYRYRIVASLTKKDDPSGDSTLSYSKLMYRLKTVAIRSANNTEPGKVAVKFDKTTSGDGYVLQYSENEDMSNAKTKVIPSADTTTCVLGGFKKGKTYYISIRVRKTVNKITYYTTFGTARKVVIKK